MSQKSFLDHATWKYIKNIANVAIWQQFNCSQTFSAIDIYVHVFIKGANINYSFFKLRTKSLSGLFNSDIFPNLVFLHIKNSWNTSLHQPFVSKMRYPSSLTNSLKYHPQITTAPKCKLISGPSRSESTPMNSYTADSPVVGGGR